LDKIPEEKIIYLDQSGIDSNEEFPYGYALKGKRCYGNKAGRGERISFIAALEQGKIIAPMTFKGSCNRDLFEMWLQEFLLPSVPQGSVLVMDNASWHKGGDIAKIVEDAGCRILYLAPYSPEDNPIEHWWAKIKNAIRKIMSDFLIPHDAVDHVFRLLE
jgi:transposase